MLNPHSTPERDTDAVYRVYSIIKNYTGGLSEQEVQNKIYRLDVENDETWVEVGEMREARASHAVSLINYSDVEQFCEGSGDSTCN